MRQLKKSLSKIILFTLFSFSGCFSDYETLKRESSVCYNEPSWAINIPNDKNKIYGVGIAGENINGENAQRKSAISKAINEIAAQLNTKVKSVYFDKKDSNNNIFIQNITFQTIDNQKVSAKIIKSCKNLNNGMFYILMESE